MKNKIISVFIEVKIKNRFIKPQPKDDIQNHLLQKPVATGYSTNQP